MCDSIANGPRRGVPAGDIIQPFMNLVVSNSVTTTNVFATTYRGDGGLLSNITTGLVQPLANLVVSNTVTTTNEAVSGTLTVSGAMTSNAANTTFFYDTFTIPYINTQLLNVAAVTGLTSANITTLNVQSLFANSATIYGASTLNVFGISNLNSAILMNNLYASNALTATNVFAITANVGTLNVSSISNLSTLVIRNNLYAPNTLSTTNVFATTANVGTLNVATVSNLSSLTTNLIATTANVGTLNVATVSNLSTLVLTNNLYASNALSTTNLFVTTANVGTLNVITVSNLANLIVSNTVTTTNIVAAGFTSNSTNTVFNFDTLTIPFINSTSLNVSAASNLSTLRVTSLNVSSTSNLGQVVSSGQVVATGKSGVGVCPPIVYRQGGSATNWNAPGSNTTPNVYAITSGVVQMQCGANVMTGTTQFIPFPVAYTNNPTVLVTSYSTTGNIWVASVTSAAFSVSANVAVQFEWMSIGI